MGDRLAAVSYGRSKKNLNKKGLVSRVEMKLRCTVFPKYLIFVKKIYVIITFFAKN